MLVSLKLPNSLAILIKKLKKSKYRKEENLFVAEGKKICSELISSNYKTEFVVVNKDCIDDEILLLIENFRKRNVCIYETKQSIFETLCDTVTPQGILAVAIPIEPQIVSNTSFVALDNISDPGNVGTIIRTSEWFGIKQILLIGECADKYNSKVIRASMGSIFRMNIVYVENNSLEIFHSFFNNQKVFAASLDSTLLLQDIEKTVEPFGLIVGNESRGISQFLDEIISYKFLINGFGNAESLNVAVATGISLYNLQ